MWKRNELFCLKAGTQNLLLTCWSNFFQVINFPRESSWVVVIESPRNIKKWDRLTISMTRTFPFWLYYPKQTCEVSTRRSCPQITQSNMKIPMAHGQNWIPLNTNTRTRKRKRRLLYLNRLPLRVAIVPFEQLKILEVARPDLPCPLAFMKTLFQWILSSIINGTYLKKISIRTISQN